MIDGTPSDYSTLDGMGTDRLPFAEVWEDYVRSTDANVDRPIRWTFRLFEVAAGDIARLKAELKRGGYSVTTSAYASESFVSKVAATKVEHHTADSMAEAWKFFESLASRYSCSFGGVEYKESGNDAI
jgi:hypothetical protein